MVGRLVSKLSTRTRDVVRVGQVPISVDHEEGAREFRGQRIAAAHTEHKIRRVVSAPRTGIVEVVLGVKRIVPDETIEEAGLQQESLTEGGKIGKVGLGTEEGQ